MRHLPVLVAGVLAALPLLADEPPPNPAIDMNGHLRLTAEAAELREARRVSEDEFLRMSREPGTVILDARSQEKYDELHVKGAIHLSFPDFTAETLSRYSGECHARSDLLQQ